MAARNSCVRQNHPRIVTATGRFVKCGIIQSGHRLGDLAEAARISQGSLSNYLAGIRSDRRVQVAIWAAFRDLTGQSISLERLWGDLLAKRKAG